MLIYHMRGNSNAAVSSNLAKYVKKCYKSKVTHKRKAIHPKESVRSGQKKSRKKSLSKKNKNFLEGLGLKVKQTVENC